MEENIWENFKDVKLERRPEKDDILVRYTAIAELVDGEDKKELINLIFSDGRMMSAINFMRNLFCAIEEDSYRVPKEIIKDYSEKKMSVEEILEKPYRYQMEKLFFTKDKFFPKDDPHWQRINLISLEKSKDDDN